MAFPGSFVHMWLSASRSGSGCALRSYPKVEVSTPTSILQNVAWTRLTPAPLGDATT